MLAWVEIGAKTKFWGGEAVTESTRKELESFLKGLWDVENMADEPTDLGCASNRKGRTVGQGAGCCCRKRRCPTFALWYVLVLSLFLLPREHIPFSRYLLTHPH